MTMRWLLLAAMTVGFLVACGGSTPPAAGAAAGQSNASTVDEPDDKGSPPAAENTTQSGKASGRELLDDNPEPGPDVPASSGVTKETTAVPTAEETSGKEAQAPLESETVAVPPGDNPCSREAVEAAWKVMGADSLKQFLDLPEEGYDEMAMGGTKVATLIGAFHEDKCFEVLVASGSSLEPLNWASFLRLGDGKLAGDKQGVECSIGDPAEAVDFDHDGQDEFIGVVPDLDTSMESPETERTGIYRVRDGAFQTLWEKETLFDDTRVRNKRPYTVRKVVLLFEDLDGDGTDELIETAKTSRFSDEAHGKPIGEPAETRSTYKFDGARFVEWNGSGVVAKGASTTDDGQGAAGSGNKVAGRWLVNDDGTVLDERTSLTWTREAAPSKLTQKKAKAYCAKLRTAGHKGWSLPTVEELKTIVTCDPGDVCCKKIASCRADSGYQANRICGECVSWRVWIQSDACFRNEEVWHGPCRDYWTSDAMPCRFTDIKPKGKPGKCALEVNFRAPGVGKFSIESLSDVRCVLRPKKKR